MRKKWVAVLCVCLLLAVCAGCGNKEETSAAAALVKTQAGYDLYGQLLHAYDSAVLPPELQRMLLLMFANVADADQTTQ